MKPFTTIMTIGLAILSLAVWPACGSGESISTVGNPGFELPEGDKAFYSPAVDTTPVIRATATSSSVSSTRGQVAKRQTTGWESGNPVFEIFNAFQEYQYPRDEGTIDVSNIYKLLFEAGNNYDTAVGEVVELMSPATITAPFDFGNGPGTYTHASDNYALSQDGDTINAILTWIWDESPKMSYGVIEGSFNNTTGDLSLDMVYLVDYEGESDYALRTFIEGNETTHQFTLKAAKFNTGEGNYAISMVGAGVSQSDLETDYFLIKILDNNNLSAFPEGRYYEFTASADEDELSAHPVSGYAAGEIADPNNYTATIEAITPFALDGSDHATSVADFSSSTLTLDY